MNKKWLITGFVMIIGLMILHCNYQSFYQLFNTTDQTNVIIQSTQQTCAEDSDCINALCSTGSGTCSCTSANPCTCSSGECYCQADGCFCLSNSTCFSGNCTSEYCRPCQNTGTTCTSSGNCCNTDCDNGLCSNVSGSDNSSSSSNKSTRQEIGLGAIVGAGVATAITTAKNYGTDFMQNLIKRLWNSDEFVPSATTEAKFQGEYDTVNYNDNEVKTDLGEAEDDNTLDDYINPEYMADLEAAEEAGTVTADLTDLAL